MEDKIDNLKRAFDYIRKFYNEVAKLLSDVIDLMSKEGWDQDPPGGSITDDYSYSLDYPNHWKCHYIYKNFLNQKISTLIKGIVIVFDESMNNFPASIVCGNLLKSSESYDKYGIYWLAVNNKKKLADLSGKAIPLTTENSGITLEGNIFAISLSEIESYEDINEKIVKKLLDLK